MMILFTLLQMKSAECRVACINYGFDSGVYRDKVCVCETYKDYKMMTRKTKIRAVPSDAGIVIYDY